MLAMYSGYKKLLFKIKVISARLTYFEKVIGHGMYDLIGRSWLVASYL